MDLLKVCICEYSEEPSLAEIDFLGVKSEKRNRSKRLGFVVIKRSGYRVEIVCRIKLE